MPQVIFIDGRSSYWPHDLLVASMTPSPKEPTDKQLQHQLVLIVDDLLHLYHEGIRVPTPSCPEGNVLC
jgi:hypothetical protein